MGEINKIQIFYSQESNGPGKVVKNLIKGLEKNNVEFILNGEPIIGIKKICLSNHHVLNGNIDDFFIGPNICTLPIDNGIVMGKKYKKYIVNSDWTYNAYKKWLPEDKLDIWPVGIDTDLFSNKSEIKKEYDCLIYFKRRNDSDLNFVENFLKNNNQTYNIIKYGSYNEEYFIDLISKSKYGIVIDNCESQGIAIQEMMSCNLPILVWDVKTWNDRGPSLEVSATSIPYWSNKCGEFFFYKEELNNIFEIFYSKIKEYNPRDFILNNLSLEKKAQDLINILKQ